MEGKCVEQGKKMRNHRCQHVEQSFDNTNVQFLYPSLYQSSTSPILLSTIAIPFLFSPDQCPILIISRELETKANMTQPSINSLPLGNSVYLSLDAAPESIKIYQDLAKSYQWYDKTRDYATGASNLVSQNSLSRSYGKMTKNRRRAPNTSHIASTK